MGYCGPSNSHKHVSWMTPPCIQLGPENQEIPFGNWSHVQVMWNSPTGFKTHTNAKWVKRSKQRHCLVLFMPFPSHMKFQITFPPIHTHWEISGKNQQAMSYIKTIIGQCSCASHNVAPPTYWHENNSKVSPIWFDYILPILRELFASIK